MATVAAGSQSCSENSPPPSGWQLTRVELKQLGAWPDLVHCHVTLTVEGLENWAVTLVGVGGAGVVQ